MSFDNLLVNAVEARHLAPMDKGGTSDPYLKLKCSYNRQHFKTRIIDKTLEPVWGDTFKFHNPMIEDGILQITVWDKDKWSKDDFLGEISIPLNTLEGGVPLDKWYTLENEPKKKKDPCPAELHLILTLSAPEEKKKKSEAPAGAVVEFEESPEGTTLEDNYTIGKELGRGGFSVVKEAKHKKTGEICAVKCINKKNVSEEELTLLGREIDIMKKLRNPNIVRLIEIFDTDNDLFLILELVKGGELFDQIVERGNYSEADAASIVHQMLRAIEYMHENGVAHRDLKPENLLCGGKNGEVIKIADFGLSKDFGQSNLQTSCGTPGYVAPEVLEGEPYDNAVDIWSVGVITYVLLCGFTPFYGENQRELFDQIIHVDYSFPDPEWTNISKHAKDFIRQILVKNPAKRLTAKQGMAHPWIVGKAPKDKLPNMESFRDLLTDYNTKAKQ